MVSNPGRHLLVLVVGVETPAFVILVGHTARGDGIDVRMPGSAQNKSMVVNGEKPKIFPIFLVWGVRGNFQQKAWAESLTDWIGQPGGIPREKCGNLGRADFLEGDRGIGKLGGTANMIASNS